MEEDKEELTMENVPKAVNYLINEIAEMRVLLEHIESQLGLDVDKHKPITIDQAAEFLNDTPKSINKSVRNKEIPYYGRGKKIYFFKDDLIKWIENGKI